MSFHIWMWTKGWREKVEIKGEHPTSGEIKDFSEDPYSGYIENTSTPLKARDSVGKLRFQSISKGDIALSLD